MSTKHNYLLGHLAVEINSPIFSNKRFFSMSAAVPKERVNLVLKQKVGLGILGATLKGHIEPEKQIIERIELYKKREKIAFISFKISTYAALQIQKFIKSFTELDSSNYAACNYYGGAFCPLYKKEGAGCSAFAISLLKVANIYPVEADKWLVKINIPMNLIGGIYNNGKKIKNRDIINANKWHDGVGVENIDYVYYQLYDPSIIYDWIIREGFRNDNNFIPVQRDGINGLYKDCSKSAIKSDFLFIERKNPNLFIQKFQQIIN